MCSLEMPITAPGPLNCLTVSVPLLSVGLPGVRLWLNFSLLLWQASGIRKVPSVLCRLCHSNNWPRQKRKWEKGKDEWRPFSTQSLKILNKMHFRDLLESFLLTNKFVKEKKQKQMAAPSEKLLLNISYCYFVE